MASPLADELDRTARQVRLPGGTVHRLALATTGRNGRLYGTDCRKTLYGYDGAVLTTDDVDCSRCNGIALQHRGGEGGN